MRNNQFKLFLTALAAAFLAGSADAVEFNAEQALKTARQNSESSKTVAGTMISSALAASKSSKGDEGRFSRDADIIRKIRKPVLESLRDYFSYEDEGRACGIKASDVWGHEISDISFEATSIKSVTVETLVSGWTNDCAGRLRFACSTTLVQVKGKLKEAVSDCAEDE